MNGLIHGQRLPLAELGAVAQVPAVRAFRDVAAVLLEEHTLHFRVRQLRMVAIPEAGQAIRDGAAPVPDRYFGGLRPR